jgi:ribosomal protein S18 acetylase RimI-like enzyme
MQVRRCTTVRAVLDPTGTWWEACAYGGVDRVRYEMWHEGQVEASLVIWAMEPLSQRWGRRAAGLIDLWTLPGRRRQGLAVCLVGEVLRQLAADGYALVEAQVAADNAPAARLFTGLGFAETEQGTLLVKRGSDGAAETG